MNPRSLWCTAIMCVVTIPMTACGVGDPATYVASAQKYMAKSDNNAAVIELKNALKADPNRADARYLLAKVSFETGNYADAVTEARKALDLNYPADEALPLLLRALLLQGEFRKVVTEPVDRKFGRPAVRADIETSRALAYIALDDRNAAQVALDSALAADPANLQAKAARIRLAVSANDLPGALEQANAVLSTAPDEVEVLLLKADLQAALGLRDESIKTLDRVVAVKPDLPQARWALIVALVYSGRIAEAANHFAEAKKLAPDDPRTWFSEAVLAYAQSNMPAARQAVDRARQFNPDYVPALYLSGLIDLRLEANAAAEAALRAVIAKAPNDEGARRALATAFVRRGKTSQALETLEPLLRRAPNDPSLLRAIAEVHFASNNPAKAAEYFAKANKLDAGNVPGRIRLAQVKLVTGESAQAIRDLEGIAASESAATEPDLALISALLQRRDFDKALVAVAALEKKQPSSAITYNVKGVVYMTRGDKENARASFEKSLSLDHDYVAAAFNLARLDFIEGKLDAARARYQQMLAKDPQSEPVLLALAELLAVTKAPPGEVKAAIERAIAANPTSIRPRLVLINYNGQLRDWNAAVAAAQKAEVALPDSLQVVEALGTAQFAAGASNQAIDSFKRAVQMQPTNPEPLMQLAELQAKMNDYDGSIASMLAAVTLAPDVPAVWISLAAGYANAGRIEPGIDQARRMQRQHADWAGGFVVEAELKAQQKNWPESAAAYRAALARQPAPFLVGRLHSALLAAGKPDEANAVSQRWLKDHPLDVTVRAYLAEQRLASKDYRGAVSQLSDALRIEPDNLMLLNNIGWALNELGDPKAVEFAERAYAQAPQSASTADTYGWVLVTRGDVARGVALLRQAVELEPSDTGKRMRLARALIKAGDKDAARKELGNLSKSDVAPPVRAEAEKLLKEL